MYLRFLILFYFITIQHTSILVALSLNTRPAITPESLKSRYTTIRSKLISAIAFFPATAAYATTTTSNIQTTTPTSTKKPSLYSDEFVISFNTDYLGMILGEEEYKGSTRIIVKDTKLDGEAAQYNADIQGSILVQIGDENVEGRTINSANIAKLVKSLPRPLNIKFRNPALFFQKLKLQSNYVGRSTENTDIISTVIRPASNERPEEVLKVEILKRPDSCVAQASPGDVLEISYEMKLSDGTIVSKSGETSNLDENFFFALGSSASDPFPQGWDYGLIGMCLGESRRVYNPPCLGYGTRGLRTYSIPANATLIYDVSLVSINGIAI